MTGGLTDAEVVLTVDEVIALANAKYAHDHGASLQAAVRRIIAARTADAAARLTAVVASVADCPHGARHYYAADATCQRCQMPSWVEATVRAALSATAPDAGQREAQERAEGGPA